MSTPVRLHISPAEALIDVPRQIQVQGLRPGEAITLQSRTVRGPGVAWVATARYQADAAARSTWAAMPRCRGRPTKAWMPWA
jgi:hypothetical protein